MRAVIVLDSGKYSYHGEAAEVLSGELSDMDVESCRVDMALGEELHEKFVKIRSFEPDFLISFDLAGFALRTETDRASYNILPMRMAHILFQENEEEYIPHLGELFNFSMFFYAVEEELERRLRTVVPPLPNIGFCPELSELKLAGEADFDPEGVEAGVEKFLGRFAAEAELGLNE